MGVYGIKSAQVELCLILNKYFTKFHKQSSCGLLNSTPIYMRKKINFFVEIYQKFPNTFFNIKTQKIVLKINLPYYHVKKF